MGLEILALLAWALVGVLFVVAVGFVFYVAYKYVRNNDPSVLRQLAEAKEQVKQLSMLQSQAQ